MPHDKNGSLLHVGDEVYMRFIVKSISTEERDCNVNLESVEPRFPTQYKTELCAVNTRQVVLLERYMQEKLY